MHRLPHPATGRCKAWRVFILSGSNSIYTQPSSHICSLLLNTAMTQHLMLAMSLCLAALLMLMPSVGQAGRFNGLVVFGDSGADSGEGPRNSIAPTSGVGYYRVPATGSTILEATWSNGRSTPQYLPGLLGSGNSFRNFAIGGGMTHSALSEWWVADTTTQSIRNSSQTVAQFRAYRDSIGLDFAAQVPKYRAEAGRANPDALYVVQIGSNDFASYAGRLEACNTTGTGATPACWFENSLASMGNSFAELAAMGAKTVAIISLGDWGNFAFAHYAVSSNNCTGYENGTTQTTIPCDTYRAGVRSAANAANLGAYGSMATWAARTGMRFIPVNSFAWLQEVVQNPALHGFHDVAALGVVRACLETASNNCLANSDPDALADRFIFWDSVHYSAAGMASLARYTAATILGPQGAAVIGDLAAELGHLLLRDQTGLTMPFGQGWRVELSLLDVNQPGADLEYGYSLDGSQWLVGYEFDESLSGWRTMLDLGWQTGEASPDNGGSIELHNLLVRGTVIKGFGNNRLVGQFAIGDSEYRFKRATGFAGGIASASPGGSQQLLALTWAQPMDTRPIAIHYRLLYNDSKVDGYTEGGALSLNQRVGSQSVQSLRAEFTLKMESLLQPGDGRVFPFGQFTLRHEFDDHSRMVMVAQDRLVRDCTAALDGLAAAGGGPYDCHYRYGLETEDPEQRQLLGIAGLGFSTGEGVVRLGYSFNLQGDGARVSQWFVQYRLLTGLSAY